MITLFQNGVIWSGKANSQTFDGLLIDNSKIIATGSAALASSYDEVVDLGGAFLMPSFADGHAHPLFGGRQFFGPQITGLESIKEIVSEVGSFAKANPSLEWIIGGTYDPAISPQGNFDSRWLDEAISDRPIVLHAMDYHTIWVNSEALRRSDVDVNTKDMEIGTIVRRDDGSPLGTMREWDAINLILNNAPRPSLEREIAAIKYSCQRYVKSGLTWWQDAWVDRGMAEAYLAAEEAGAISLGINLAFRADPRTWEIDLPYFLERKKEIESSLKNKNLTANTIKFFSDGVIEGGTAALLEPYTDDPCYHGMPVWSAKDLTSSVTAFDAAGFQVHIHAIGDAGIRQALDAIEYTQKVNPQWDRRPVIAHVQLVNDADLPRFAKLGVIANFGPLWTKQDPMQVISSAPRIGEIRTAKQYQMRTLIDLGTRLTFGSDWPVTSEVPLLGMPVAVHRQTPDRMPPGGWIAHEAIRMDEAMAAYTSNVAYQGFAEKLWGTLTPGLNADFIILSNNPLKIEPHDVPNLEILSTYRNGKALYTKA